MKKITSLLLLLVMMLAIPFSSVLAEDTPTTEVNGVLSTNIAGGYGKGIAVEFTNSLGLGYWDKLESTHIELKNPHNEAVDIVVESVGAQISINRGKGYEYYGYVLTIQAGFRATKISDGTASGPITTETKSFIFKGNVENGGAWEAYVPVTELNVTQLDATIKVFETTHQIEATMTPETTNAIVAYQSSNQAVATVSSTGLVTPHEAGTATITVTAGTLTKEVLITVEGATLAQEGIIVTNTDKKVVIQKNREFLNVLKVAKLMADDVIGDLIPITIENISGTYDLAVPGVYTLTVTVETYTDTFTLEVLEIPEVKITRYGDDSPWGEIYFIFDQTDISQYLTVKEEALEQILSTITIAGSKDNVEYVKNLGGTRYEFRFKNTYKPKAGDKIEIEAGFALWQYEGGTVDQNHVAKDGKYITIGEMKEDYVLVYTGSEWVPFVAEPTDFELTSPAPVVAVGATAQLGYKVSPDGAFGTPVFTSSDDTIATVSALGVVTGISKGTVTITAVLGSIEKEITIEIGEPKPIKHLEITDAFEMYHVLKDSNSALFSPVLKAYRVVFEDDTYSSEIELVDYEIVAFDTTTTGSKQVIVKITHQSEVYEVILSVEVYEYYDQSISQVAIVDWFQYSVFAQLPFTSTNAGNLTSASMIAGLKDKVTYTRADGTDVEIKTIYVLQTNIAIFPAFLYEDGKPILTAENYNDYYQAGDKITFAAQTPMYKWVGEKDSTNTAIKDKGEVFIEGFITQEVVYRYNGNVWQIYIEYTDIQVDNENLTVQIGQNVISGVKRVPDNATTGVFTYLSSNTQIVTVTANGIITGHQEGTATITVTLADPDRPEDQKTVILNITVVDYISGIEISDLTVDQDGKIDLSKAEAYFKWASGKKGEKVDLKNAVISGVDTAVLGEQDGVVSIIIEGKTYTGQVKVTVKEAKSNIVIFAIIGVVVAGSIAAGAVLWIKKRKTV